MKKTSILISIALVFMLALSAASAAEDTSFAADDALADAAAEQVQAIDDTQTNDVSYESTDIIVNDTSDSADSNAKNLKAASNEEQLAAADTSFTQLQSDIAASQYGIFTVSKDYAYDADYDSALAGGIDLSGTLTIVGGGHTIDGSGIARIFNIAQGSNIVFVNLKLTNAGNSAIYNEGTAVLSGTDITNSAAEKGAAIYNTATGSIEASDCEFIDNTAVYRGGAIYSEGTVKLTDSIIDSNDVTYRAKNDDNGGAAIYNLGGTLELDNVQVTNNLKDIVIRDGNDGHLINAAIFTTGDATITNSNISKNSGSWGGGIYVTGDATLTVTDTTFEENMATFGAAIYDEGANLIVDNCTFTKNYCEGIGSPGTADGQAGAILVMASGSATITDSTFTENSAKVGGAISFAGAEDSTVSGCTFTANNGASEGGAIYSWTQDDATVTVSSNTFTDNVAPFGSAISNDGDMSLAGNTITGYATTPIGNYYGTIDSEVYVKILNGETVTTTTPTNTITAIMTDDNNNPIIDNNLVLLVNGEEVATTYDKPTGVMTGSYTFTNPSTYEVTAKDFDAEHTTAATIVFDSPLKSLQDLINENTNGTIDLTYGFAYLASYDEANIATGIIVNKDIILNGNGVTIDGADVSRLFTVTNGATLTLNNIVLTKGAADNGAAVYVASGAKLDATATTIKDSVATYSGGAIYTDGGEIVLTNSVLDNNDVTDYTKNNDTGGAAIFGNNSAKLTLVNTNVTNNGNKELDRSKDDLVNAVINLLDSDATISGCVFENNTGIYGGAIAIQAPSGEKTLTITDSNFIANAAYTGGAVYVGPNVKFTISDSTFDSNNKATGEGSPGYTSGGGAIQLWHAGEGTIDHVTIKNSIATQGGAIGVEGSSPVTIKNSTFESNSATSEGGAIYAYRDVVLTVTGSTFTDNDAPFGSAISNDGALTLSGNTIAGGSTVPIANYFGDIKSEIFVKILDGQTVTTSTATNEITAVLTDDNNNAIIDKTLVLIINDEEVATSYNRITGVMTGSYTFTAPGTYEVTAKDFDAAHTTSGTLVYTEGTYTELQNLIDAAEEGATITLTHDIVYNAAFDGTPFVDGIIVNKSVIIIGAEGIDVCGNDLARVFKVTDGATLTLKDLTVCDGKADDGAGVYVEAGAKLNADNVLFTENAATYRGGAIYSEGTVNADNSVFDKNDITYRTENKNYGGAAIYNNDGTLVLDNCNVTNNVKDYVIRGTDGATGDLITGAITTSGTNTIKNTVFENNSGCYGADITITKQTKDATLTIENSNFTGATSYAGDVYVSDATLTVDNSRFENNTATGVGSDGYTSAGGAIAGLAGSDITVKNSLFKNNSAPLGGAIYTEATETKASTLTVDNCTFELNNATRGVNNGGKGGAIYAAHYVTLDVDDSRFINNAATSGLNYGAGIFIDYNATASVTDSNFTGNTGSLGKAIFNYGTLSQSGNKVDTASNQIYSPGKLISKLVITIFENNTLDIRSQGHPYAGFMINSTVTDSDGNVVNGLNYNITVGDVYSAKVTSAYIINWKPVVNGTYLLNAVYSGNEELVVNTAVLRVHNTLTDLATLINKNRNGTLDLDGDYSYSELFDSALVNGIVINKTITINGNNHIINGSDLARLFNVATGALTLNDVTIANGAATNGAGVYVANGASLIANGATFTENKAANNGGAIYSDGALTITDSKFDANDISARHTSGEYGGAAIYSAANGVLALSSSEVTNNNPSYTDGDKVYGAVTVFGQAVITDVTFTNNKGRWGGAIGSYGYGSGTLTVKDSRFEENEAYQGGAIFAQKKEFIVDNCNFTKNTATDGGAIDHDSEKTAIATVISNSNFDDNTATRYGSATFALSGFTYTNCNFTNNKAPAGTATVHYCTSANGLGDVNYGDSTIDECRFEDNSAAYYGSVYFYGTKSLTVSNTNFTNNKATNADAKSGAIFFYGNSLTVINDIFTGNKANKGGAIYTYSTTTISASKFIGNDPEEGGALYVGAGTTTVKENCEFNENTADFGGAIYAAADTVLNVENSKFTKNSAVNKGGAIYTLGKLTVTNSEFDQNDITYRTDGDLENGGAAIYAGIGSDLTITGSDFTNNLLNYNMATDKVLGAVAVVETATITDSTFTNNAGRWGGAISATGYADPDKDGKLTINNVVFAKNNANQGGAVFAQLSDLVIEDSKFIENTAYDGGAILHDSAIQMDGVENKYTAAISNTLFDGNIATRYGSAIEALSAFTYTKCNFTNNKANGGTGTIHYFGSTADTVLADDSVIDGCRFEGNTANYYDVYFYGTKSLDIKDSIFKGANVGYATVLFSGDKLTVSGTSFEDNTAGKYGGAIYADKATTVDISGSNFTRNSAGTYGGAVLINSGITAATISDCEFIGNSVPTYGGAVFTSSPTTITGSLFQDNTGSAKVFNIYHGSTLTLTDNTFKTLKAENVTIDVEKDTYAYGDTIPVTGAFDWGVNNYAITLPVDLTNEGTTETKNQENFKAGNIAFTLEDLAPGAYTVDIKTFTDENGNQYIVETATDSFTIEKQNATLTVTVEDIIDGGDAVVLVTLTGINDSGLTDTVTVILNNTQYTIDVSEGTGSKTIEGLAHGSYPVVAMLDESANYNSAINSTIFYVKAATVLTIDEIGEVEYGEPIEATIHLTDKEGNGINGVVVVLGTNVLVEDGVGILTIDTQPDVGTYKLTAEYAGTNDYNASASETVSFTVITTDAVIDFHHRVTESGEDGVLFGGIANVLRDDDGNIVYDEEGNPVPDDESYVDDEFTLIFKDEDGVEVLKLEGLSSEDGAISLPDTGDLPIGKYTVTVVLDDNYNLLADTFEFEVNPKSVQAGVDLGEIDITEGETTTVYITVGDGKVYAFTSYGDEDGEGPVYSTGTVLILEEGGEWTKVKVLTNDADPSYVGQEFYVESDDRFWHIKELFLDEGETSTGIYVRTHESGVVPQDIDGTATITIHNGDDDGTVIQVIENVPITEGKGQIELPVLPVGEYFFKVTVDADGYDIEDGEFYDCLVVWVKEGTYTHLQQIINDGINDEDRYNEEDNSVWIDLDNDFAFDPDYDAALAGGVVIDSDKIVKINGNDHTISGSDLARIFYITEGTQVELMNVVLADGAVTDNGAAIYSAGNLTVHDSVFKDNKVTEGTTWAPGAPAAGGAAIYSAPDSSLEIWSVEFLNNEAVHGFYNSFTCGAVYASGAEYVSIRDSKFEGNAAVLGGAVTIEFYHVDADSQDEEPTISNCDFNDNLAWQGGAVNINEDVPYLNIADCRFNGNQAVDPNSGDASPAGGAISVGTGSYGTELVLNYCGFLGNSATNVGGAVALINPVCELYANGCEFESNTATYGGAIYFYGNEAVITDTNFASNDPDYGGALFIATGDVSLDNVEFSENSADYGGAIYLANGASLDIANARFHDNVATNRGGAIFASGDLTVKDTEFNGNSITEREANAAGQETGGAAIYVGTSGVANVKDSRFTNSNPDYELGDKVYGAVLVAGTAEFDGCNFEDNKARWGAAIGVNGDIGETGAAYVKVANSYFARNEAVQGGAIHIENASMDIEGCDFDANVAKVASGAYAQGAAIFVNGGQFDITGTNFRNGNSEQNSGAIHLYQTESFGDSTITNCNFDDNYAGLYYGAIYFYAPEDSLTITGSNFNNNKAQNTEVGAIRFMGKDLTISGTNFNNNEDPIYGAVYYYTYSDAGKLTITDSSFRNNKGTAYSGALFIYNGEATVDNTQFAYNEGGLGAIWNYAGTLTVTNSLFEDNSGRANMYNIYTQSGTTSISGTTFKIIRNVNIDLEESYAYGEDVTATGTFDWGVNKFPITMKYAIDGVEGTAAVNNAAFTADLGNELAVGSHTMIIKSFTDEFGNSYVVDAAESTFEVTKSANAVVTVTPSAESYAYGSDVVIDVTLKDGETNLNGYVIVTVDNVDYAVSVNDGAKSLTVKGLSNGTYPVTAKFIGNDNYDAADAEAASFVVNATKDVTVSVTANEPVYGEDAILTVTITDADGNVVTVEKVNVTIGEDTTEYDVEADGTVKLGKLPVGPHTATVTLADGETVIGSSDPITFTVEKATSSVDITPVTGTVAYPGEVNITFTASAEPTITVVDAEGNPVSYTIVDGKIALTNLAAGTYTVTVAIADSENITGSSDTITFTVDQATMSPTVTVAPEEVSIVETFKVTASDYYGDASVEINGETYALDEEISLPEGTYKVKVVFAGNENYTGTTVNKTVTVVKKSVSPETALNITIPENSTAPVFSIELPEDATGYLLVDIDGEQYYAPLENGKASIAVDPLAGGNHTATITYTGDENYAGITNTTTVSIASNITADTALDIPTNSETTSPTFSVNLPADATGYLVVDVDGKKYAAVVENGTASVTVPGLSEGDHNVTVTYSGDSKYPSLSKDATVNVHVPVYNITNNKNISVVYSTKVYYKVLVTKDGKAVGAGESVTIKYNGKTYTVKTDKNGYASLKLKTNIKVKKYAITATYKGVTVKNTVRIKHVIKVYNKKAKRSKKLVLKIKTKKVNGKYLKGKKLKLKFRGKTYKAKINKKGVAKFTIKKSVMRKLKVGKKYKYRVTYGKDKITKKIKIRA